MSDLQHDEQHLHERVLVLRAQTGDRRAFHELVDLYQQRLTYYVHRLIPDIHQTRDILQQVWLDVFRQLGKLRSPAAFRVWLYRIAHNRVVSCIRIEVTASETRQELAADDVDRSNDQEMLENADLVHFALNKLSVPHREVMTLRFLEDLDIKDIAHVLQCSEGTAKSRLYYAKAAMRRIIDQELGHA